MFWWQVEGSGTWDRQVQQAEASGLCARLPPVTFRPTNDLAVDPAAGLREDIDLSTVNRRDLPEPD